MRGKLKGKQFFPLPPLRKGLILPIKDNRIKFTSKRFFAYCGKITRGGCIMSTSIGTVATLSGTVTAATEDGSLRTLTQGDPIFQDDTISTQDLLHHRNAL